MEKEEAIMPGVSCPKCGTELLDGQYCRKCGYHFEGAVSAETHNVPIQEPVEPTKRFSALSIVSLAISLLGVLLYYLLLSHTSFFFMPFFIVSAFASLILPIVAKKRRTARGMKGKAFEIAAIVIGGFDFYFFIFALTQAPVFIGYLGWIVCAIAYKLICSEKKYV